MVAGRTAALPRILIIDDEELLRSSARHALEPAGYELIEAATGASGVAKIREGVDLVLLDYALPDMNGDEVLELAQTHAPRTPVIMLTGHASIRQAVAMMNAGAFSYLAKPFELEELAPLVRRALASRGSGGGDAPEDDRLAHIVGSSPAMRSLHAKLRRVAESKGSTVLITGESGTGKDLVAYALHELSSRIGQPFVNITCSALPATLLESELFGHEKGAFTDARSRKIGLFEHAHHGSVFLDEIGELSLALQAKLLRVLEQKTVRRVGGTVDVPTDVRVIGATNVNLEQAVKAGHFRLDLYYRLAVLRLEVPALRDRREDIPMLVEHFISRFNEDLGRACRGITPRALDRLMSYDWPGNVRELRNTIERAMLLATEPMLDVQDLEDLRPGRRGPTARDFVLPSRGLNLRDLERTLVIQALEETGWNQVQAARLLGMNRDQVRYRIEKFGLEERSKRSRSG